LNIRLITFLKAFLVIYVLAMVLSLFIQLKFPVTDQPYLYQHSKTITADNREIEIHYLHLENPESNRSLILLPDYLDNADYLLPLAESLQSRFDVKIPIYPTHDLAGRSLDHSLDVRANIINTFTDSLAADSFHLLGYGYGGLTAFALLNNFGADQEKYRSLTLLSSLGPVELHFLGNHTINRSLYALLYPAVTFFKYLTPHMGWFHHQPIDYSFIKTLRSMDQRDVREQVKNIEQPVLILHPLQDNYVSLAVAEENHRILPQSYLATNEGPHQEIFENPDIWKTHIFWFLENVEKGMAETRSTAEAERKKLAEKPFDAESMDTIGGWTLFIIVILLAFITLLNEDIACIGAGLIVAGGVLDFWIAVLGCFAGILLSDTIIYLMGRWIGTPVLSWVPFKWFINKEDIDRAERMFKMKGIGIIFAARFLPGTRLPTYLVAGMLKTKFWSFFGYFVIAISIWAPILIGLSALIGQPMLQYLHVYQEYAIWLLPIIIILIYTVIKLIIPLATVTGRRKLLVKWGRFKERNFDR
jgi:membrane protein DedA with SNARE-associated domain/pimeloyl-ACP methyl ester carboxylesterase